MKIYITIILCLAWMISRSAEVKPFSFTHEPYINPSIVERLVCGVAARDWIDQTIAIDIYGSKGIYDLPERPYRVDGGGTNRHPFVVYEQGTSNGNPDGEIFIFGYEYIGRTDSNVIVLYTYECYGGSMSLHNLLFVTTERDKELVFEDKVMQVRERYLLKKLGQLCLGDRYKGDIKITGNQLFVSKGGCAVNC